jgi:dUTP pyrophosphatase
MVNLSADPQTIAPGERIAQLVLCETARATLEQRTALESTERGAGGFGHTGT